MKRTNVGLVATAVLLSALMLAPAADRKSRANKEFMRDKLELSQKVLEGLALEDFNLIAAKSQKLSAMSQAADWQVFDNPDYAGQSVDFRKNVDALTRAAERKNIDAATLAYVKVTMSCVDCHKLVRGKLMARNETTKGSVPFFGLAKAAWMEPATAKP
jgi:cytochrome c556